MISISNRKSFCFLWMLLAGAMSGSAAARGESPPNVLIITADNLGYGDLRSYNPQSPILTPHLDYSDNGAFMLPGRGLEVSSNEPLRDGGVTCWEGGIRVAALARLPGRIAPGSVIEQPLWSPDLSAACAKLARVELPSDRRFDGRDLLPVLSEGAASPHESLYFTFRGHAALRRGNWKIVRTAADEPWQLFNLKQDIGESKNLAASRPQRLQELVAEFARWQEDF